MILKVKFSFKMNLEDVKNVSQGDGDSKEDSPRPRPPLSPNTRFEAIAALLKYLVIKSSSLVQGYMLIDGLFCWVTPWM